MHAWLSIRLRAVRKAYRPTASHCPFEKNKTTPRENLPQEAHLKEALAKSNTIAADDGWRRRPAVGVFIWHKADRP
jgi:hypothetical protein